MLVVQTFQAGWTSIQYMLEFFYSIYWSFLLLVLGFVTLITIWMKKSSPIGTSNLDNNSLHPENPTELPPAIKQRKNQKNKKKDKRVNEKSSNADSHNNNNHNNNNDDERGKESQSSSASVMQQEVFIHIPRFRCSRI